MVSQSMDAKLPWYQRLGVRLLQRSTRRVALTDAGDVFYRHCRAMRESAQAASDAVAALRAEPSGKLRVVCPVTLSQVVLGEMLPRFLSRHPLVQLQLEQQEALRLQVGAARHAAQPTGAL